MRSDGRAVLAGLLAVSCTAQIETTQYAGLTINLNGPAGGNATESSSAQNPFSQTNAFVITLSYWEDAAGTIPYGQELGPNPPGFPGFSPTSTATYPGDMTSFNVTRDGIMPTLPRLSASQQSLYVSAEIDGQDNMQTVVARGRCGPVELQIDTTGTAEVVCQAFYGLLGEWNLMRPMNVARTDFAAVALPDGRIVVGGGRPPGIPVSSSGAGAPLSTIEIYDPYGQDPSSPPGSPPGVWIQPAGVMLRTARYGLTATVTPDGFVEFLGGMTVIPQTGMTTCSGTSATDSNACIEQPVSTVDVLDTADGGMTMTQETLTLPSTESRGQHGAALLSGDVVLVAGGVKLDNSLVVPALDFLSVDPTSSTMPGGSLANTDQERHWPCLVPVSSDQLALCSGLGWDGGVPSMGGCEAIDSSGRMLNGKDGGIPRVHTQCGVVGGTVYLAGGDVPTASEGTPIEAWGNGTLTQVALEPAAVDGNAIGATNGQIVSAGGHFASKGTADDSSSWIGDTYWFTPSLGLVTPSANLQFPRNGFQMLGMPDGTIVAIGGAVQTGFPPDGTVAPKDPGIEILVVPDPSQ